MTRNPRSLTLKGKLGSHIVLILFTLFAIYPVLQVLSISLRPGDRLLSKSLAVITENATYQ